MALLAVPIVPTPAERLQLVFQLLGDTTIRLAALRDTVSDHSMAKLLEATVGVLGNAQVQVGLLQVEGDLYAKGFNAALDAAQDMAKNASYLKAGEFALLLDHIRKEIK